MKNNWQIAEVDEKIISQLSTALKIDTLLARLLCLRNVTDVHDAFCFLNPSVSQLHSPFLMKNMYQAVEMLKKTVQSKKKVGVFSDSDLDGLTSLTVINTLLQRIGIEVFPYFPNEENSDYGLTPAVTDLFISEKIGLLITLDCGIRDVEEISRLRKEHIDVIVCDHHEVDETLPDAVILDPKQDDCTYPFNELAGVGVTFKFVQAFMYSYLPLFRRELVLMVKDEERFDLLALEDGIITTQKVSFFYPEEYARFADTSLPLFHFNIPSDDIRKTGAEKIESVESLITQAAANPYNFTRDFITQRKSAGASLINAVYDLFLEVTFSLPEKCRAFFSHILPYVAIGTVADVVPVTDENRILIMKGIEEFNQSEDPALIRLKKFVNQRIDSKAIGWQIAPLLNSPGRFGKTGLTADFITGTDSSEENFNSIHELNEYRKKYVAKMFSSITKDIGDFEDNILFVSDYEIECGITGLLASRLNEFYSKPAIVAVPVDDTVYKGSGRSKWFSIFPYIEEISSLFTRFGGHQQAFGFTIEKKNLDRFREAVAQIDTGACEEEALSAEIELDYHKVSIPLINTILKLAPFGVSNEMPLCLSRSVPVKSCLSFGKNSEHGKILTDIEGIEIIGWKMAEKMEHAASRGSVDILYYPEINTYFGKQTVRMMVCDID